MWTVGGASEFQKYLSGNEWVFVVERRLIIVLGSTGTCGNNSNPDLTLFERLSTPSAATVTAVIDPAGGAREGQILEVKPEARLQVQEAEEEQEYNEYHWNCPRNVD